MKWIFEGEAAYESEVERVTEDWIQCGALVTSNITDISVVDLSDSKYSGLLIEIMPEFLPIIELR